MELRRAVSRLCLVVLGAAFGAAHADTVLWYQSSQGDSMGQGATDELRAPGWAIEATAFAEPGAHFSITNSATGATGRLDLAPRPGATTLQEGPYEEAARYPFAGASPGLAFTLAGRQCSRVDGRFVVLEAAYGSDGHIDRLAADFEQRCDGGAPLYGELRFNSQVPLNHTTAPAGSMPEPFALQARSPVRAGVPVESNSFTVYAASIDTPVSIRGGLYSVNGGPFVSYSRFVQPLDHIVVRTQASLSPGGEAAATINVGGREATLSATTYAPGMALTGLYFASPAGEYIGQGATRWFLVPRDLVTANRDSRGGVAATIDGVGGTEWSLSLSSGTGAALSPGTYESATRYAFATTTPGLDLHGDGRSCDTLTGRFVVHEAVHAADGSVQSFAADFEQACEGMGTPLYGEIRVNSAVPFSALTGLGCSTADTDGDGVPDCTEIGLGLDPNVKDNDVFNDPTLFAMQQYRDFLGREGDSGGVRYWAGLIRNGSLTRAQATETFMASPEFQEATGSVIRLYLAYFTRYPDAPGLAFWSAYRRAGHPLAEISELFAGSAEFAQRYGSLSNSDFVSLVYMNVLGRAPDASGLEFWRSQLDSGALTRGGLMLQFSESREFLSVSRNEVFATMLYAGILRRTPDPDGFAFWLRQLDNGASTTATIDAFIGSVEYRKRFLP